MHFVRFLAFGGKSARSESLQAASLLFLLGALLYLSFSVCNVDGRASRLPPCPTFCSAATLIDDDTDSAFGSGGTAAVAGLLSFPAAARLLQGSLQVRKERRLEGGISCAQSRVPVQNAVVQVSSFFFRGDG